MSYFQDFGPNDEGCAPGCPYLAGGDHLPECEDVRLQNERERERASEARHGGRIYTWGLVDATITPAWMTALDEVARRLVVGFVSGEWGWSRDGMVHRVAEPTESELRALWGDR